MTAWRCVIGQESAPVGQPSQPVDGGPKGGKKAAPSAGGMGWIFPILILFIVFFLMIQPQRKREKERKRMVEELGRGDHVVTIGGIHGTILSLTDDEMILEVDHQKGTTLKMTRSAISRAVPDDEAEEAPDAKA